MFQYRRRGGTTKMIGVTVNKVTKLAICVSLVMTVATDETTTLEPEKLQLALENSCPVGCLRLFQNKLDLLELPVDSNINNYDPQTSSEESINETLKNFHGPNMYDVSRFSGQQFRKFCLSAYRPFVSCLRRCKHSLLKLHIELINRPTKFVCLDHYSAMRKSFDCYARVKTEYMPCCKKLYCRREEEELTKMSKSSSGSMEKNDSAEYSVPNFPDAKSAKKVMSSNCRLLKCLAPCERKILARECGPTVAKLMSEDLLRVTMASSKSLLVDSGGQPMWPPECDQIFDNSTA